jgi:sec-independent protein translocase protein TatC
MPAPEAPAAESTRMTLAEHLEELRRRLAISLAALLAAAGLSFTQVERLLEWLKRPAADLVPRFAFFSPMEPLLAYVKVSVLAGLLLAMPVILAQVWRFIRPGLTRRERWLGLTFVWWGSAQFLAGAAFAYWALLPMSLRVLLGIGRGLLEPVVSLERYLSFVTSVTLGCALVFELPVVVWLLARVGVVTPAWLWQQRPAAILALVIVSAVVTPTTDPVTLFLMAIPLWLLYELSIWVASLATPRRPSASA